MDFTYKAMESNGQIVEGIITAADQAVVVSELRKQNLSPISITAKVQTKGHQKKLFTSKKITKTDISNFTTRLAALIRAKLPLAKALNSIKNQSEKEELSKLITDIFDKIQSGSSLSDTLSTYPKHFSKLYINLVKIGEVGGVLDESLTRIADIRRRDQEIVSTLKSALTYPAIMCFVMVASIIILVTFVVPNFTSAFADMGNTLPLPTRLLIIISDFMTKWWWAVFIAIALIIIAFFQYIRKEKGRLAFDKVKLGFPLIGKLSQEIALSRFALSLGSLLKSGISLTQAMDATVEVTGNMYITGLLVSALKEVHEGISVSATFKKRPEFFTNLCIEMAQTGEDTGNLDEMLENVGKYYADESSLKIKTLTTLMEPMIIVVMGVIVGFIVMAMMLPIFDISTSIH